MKLVLLLVVIFLFGGIAGAQIVVPEKIISRIKISPELKKQLVERIEIFAKNQINKDYEKQYPLISSRLKATDDCWNFHPTCFTDFDDFIKRQKFIDQYFGGIKEIRLTDSQRKLDVERNRIILTTKIKSTDGVSHSLIYLDAFLENEIWYFSAFYWIEV